MDSNLKSKEPANERGERKTKKDSKPKKKYLAEGTHQCLSVKEMLDVMLHEGDALPQQVKQAIISARDSAWAAFVEQQESINKSIR